MTPRPLLAPGPVPAAHADLAGLDGEALAVEAARCDVEIGRLWAIAKRTHAELDWWADRRAAALKLRQGRSRKAA